MCRGLICVTLFFLLLLGCSQEQNEQPKLSADAMRRMDSLERYNDSIAKDKELHYQFQGTHSHLNTSGKLSEHAHQNLPKKRRLAKLRRQKRPERVAAYRKSQERQEQRRREHLIKTGKLLDTTAVIATDSATTAVSDSSTE